MLDLFVLAPEQAFELPRLDTAPQQLVRGQLQDIPVARGQVARPEAALSERHIRNACAPVPYQPEV